MPRATPHARRTAVAVGVAALLAALWWVVRAPPVETRAVVAPPDIDIDPPALRRRREAAISLATMPDDPWTFAESLAASAPTGAGVAPECGLDGRPTSDEAAAPGAGRTPTTGWSTRQAGARARVDAALRNSLDPFDRAVADWLDVGNMRGAAGRDEAVVQQAVASADPRLYALGVALCQANQTSMPSCAALSLERWIELDAGNGVPWLAMLERAHAQGDAASEATALAQLASATRFDTYRAAAAGVIARRARDDDPDLAAVDDLARRAAADAALLPPPASGALTSLCHDQAGGDPAMARTCRAISDALFAHSDSLAAEDLGGALLLAATGDESRRDAILAERALSTSHWSPATGFSECRDMRDRLATMVRTGQIGEVEALRERMRRFVPP